MKKIKIAFWVIVIGFLTLLMMQNQEFFFSKSSFSLDFYYKKYLTPEVPNALLFLAFFLTGLLIAYIFGLLGQYKSKRTLKDLKATMQSQMKVIADLKSEIADRDASFFSREQNRQEKKRKREARNQTFALFFFCLRKSKRLSEKFGKKSDRFAGGTPRHQTPRNSKRLSEKL